MRVALLSILDHAGEAEDGHRAFLTFAGKSLAARQLELALGIGCERIVCISDNLAHPLIALQHRVEGAGARFHVISAARALGGLIHASDELVVIADGVLPLAAEAQELLDRGNAVLTLPADEALDRGFERIDLNDAWAGALVMPGGLVERLNQLPPDCDAVSALLRIALQAGLPQRELPERLLAEGRWVRLSSQSEADQLEPQWLRRLLPAPDPFAPGNTLANWLIGRWGMSLLDRGVSARVLVSLAFVVALVAIALGWHFSVIAGLLIAMAGWMLGRSGIALGQVEKSGAARTGEGGRLASALEWVVDLALAMLLAMGAGEQFTAWPDRLFGGLFLMAGLRILAAVRRRGWSALAADRLILPIILALCSAIGVLKEGAEVLTLLALIASIAHLRLSAKLTQA
ncbi:MAG: hypothetical protein H6915_06575 [Novosphingobium sp.]|nr:hypothetical protein [Novosphingobium sp.]MCP5380516.1 hypothetical protein [Novosphingobium sp.]MCP5389414.1 hypothetical protein [Novosphingobium sp.]